MKTKLSLIALGVLATVGSAWAQTTSTTTTQQGGGSGPISAQSFDYKVTTTSINLLWLRDGHENFTALSVPYYNVPFDYKNLKLTLNAIGAVDPNDMSHKAYLGTGLNLHVSLGSSGLGLDLLGGLKGFNLADNFKFQTGAERGFVLGLGLSIPLGGK